MPLFEPFLPSKLASITLAVGAAVQHAKLPVGGSTAAANPPEVQGGECLFVQNTSATVDVYLETGPGTNLSGTETCNIVATVANSFPIPAGKSKMIRRQPGDTHMSIIGAAAGPANVYVSAGNGV